MDHFFTRIVSRAVALAGQPLAFLVAFAFILAWGITGPIFAFSDTWQLIINTTTTIITFLMVFLIQNSQNRDAAAMQAKLDELIRATNDARAQFIGIEHLTENEVEKVRADLESEVGEDGKSAAKDSVTRMRDRM